MLSMTFYFLQVIICSGVMTGYYWLVLRNNRFHQYNRFYLLAAALLSWCIPLIRIRMSSPVAAQSQPTVIRFFSVVADNNTYLDAVTGQQGSPVNWNSLILAIYLLGAAVLLTGFVAGLWKLYRLLKTEPSQRTGNVWLVFTEAKGTPFSFFRFIFWNRNVNPETSTSRQMLEHELAHVREGHTVDKLLMQVLIAAGWFNPFFWVIRREANLIHEFIADRKAVNDGEANAASLAEMLLSAAYPRQQFAFTNSFFFSPIKRRIIMLTRQHSNRFSYWRRVIALPMLAFVVLLFGFRKKEHNPYTVLKNFVKAQLADRPSYPGNGTALTDAVNDTIIRADSIRVKRMAGKLQVVVSSQGKQETVEFQTGTVLSDNAIKAGSDLKIGYPVLQNGGTILYILDGRKISANDMQGINPSDISSINVLKDSSATVLYGPEGAGGVVEIFTKGHEDKSVIVSNEVLRPGSRPRFSVTSQLEGKVSLEVFDRFNNLVYSSPDYRNDWDGIDNRRNPGTPLPGGVYFYMVTVKLVSGQEIKRRGFLTVAGEAEGNITVAGYPLKSASLGTGFTAVGHPLELPSDPPHFVQGYPVTVLNVQNVPHERAQPEFPGGLQAWSKYLARNLNSDIVSQRKAPSGKYTVMLSFMVSEEGEISNVRALTDPGYGTAEEAIRVIVKGPRWLPAVKDGKRIAMESKQSITYANP